MARSTKQASKAIEALLTEKRQIEQWLQRLDLAADKTPEGVRQRVRQDYETRLATIVEELESHRDEIRGNLERQRELGAGLARQERDLTERMSEAELRHAVGEYSEQEWSKLRTDLLQSLVKVREELETTARDIETLEGVLASLDAPAAAPAEQAHVVSPGTPASPRTPAPPPETTEPKGRGKESAKEKAKQQTDAFDELAFLKSVTEDAEHGPRPERATGAQQAVGEDEIPDLSLEEAAAAERQEKRPKPDTKTRHQHKGDVPALGASGVRPVLADAPPPSKGTTKRTLKCAECGVMNLPTEWYCESCGAELASL